MENTPSSSKDLWFLDTWVTIRVSESQNLDTISVMEHRAPFGDSPPLHIHHTEDEIFHVLEGRFYFIVGDKEYRLQAGDILHAPKGIAHQYLVESEMGGRWLTITTQGDFEKFVREIARPAERKELPERHKPTQNEIKILNEIAARFGIEIIGPPLH